MKLMKKFGWLCLYFIVVDIIFISISAFLGPNKLMVTFDKEVSVVTELGAYQSKVINHYYLGFNTKYDVRSEFLLASCYVGSDSEKNCIEGVQSREKLLSNKTMEMDNSFYQYVDFIDLGAIRFIIGLSLAMLSVIAIVVLFSLPIKKQTT